MITKINIGTNKQNFVGVKVNKPFSEITAKDIRRILNYLLSFDTSDFRIEGWADVTFPSVIGYYLVNTIENKWGVCYWDGTKFWDDPEQNGKLTFGVKNEFLTEWFRIPEQTKTIVIDELNEK